MRTLFAVLAVALVFFGATPATAQVEFGFRPGLTIADVSLDTDGVEPDFDTRTGFVAGIFLEVPLSANLSFQPGLSYAQKGAGVSESFEGEDFNFGVELDYIEAPLLLKYAFPTTGSVGVHLYGGPALAFESSCKLAFEGEGVEASVDCDAEGSDIQFDTKSFDVGAMLGAGVSFPVGARATFLVDAFYNFGLTSILDDPENEDNSLKNRTFYGTVGVSFPMGN